MASLRPYVNRELADTPRCPYSATKTLRLAGGGAQRATTAATTVSDLSQYPPYWAGSGYRNRHTRGFFSRPNHSSLRHPAAKNFSAPAPAFAPASNGLAVPTLDDLHLLNEDNTAQTSSTLHSLPGFHAEFVAKMQAEYRTRNTRLVPRVQSLQFSSYTDRTTALC